MKTDLPRLLDPLFTTDLMCQIFSDQARVQGMCLFEAALARAEAVALVIPISAAQAIASQCRAEFIDLEALGRDAALAGNLAIPFVQQLTALVANHDSSAAEFVHFGATSQDAIDTGLILQLRDALHLFEGTLARFSSILAALAADHKNTAIAGRTWMQQALPVTFGLKVAGWLSAIERHRSRLADLRSRVLVLQFGGAAGTLASLGKKGFQVAEKLAEDLGLGLPDVPWHAHRDRLAEVATTLGLLTGTLGKIARDITLLMQTEIGEVFEPFEKGKGGSSALPQKRNPVGSAVALAAAIRVPSLVSVMLTAMVQENERGMGNWHAEWETLPEICTLTAGALQHVTHAVNDLEVDIPRMSQNLEMTHGLIFAEAIVMALAPAMGRQRAKSLMEQVCRQAVEQKRHLRDVLLENPQIAEHISKSAADVLFDPVNYLGLADIMVDRVLRTASQAEFKRSESVDKPSGKHETIAKKQIDRGVETE